MAIKVSTEPAGGIENGNSAKGWIAQNWVWIVAVLGAIGLGFVGWKVAQKMLKKDDEIDYSKLEFDKTLSMAKIMANWKYKSKNIIPTVILWALLMLGINLFLIFGAKAVKTAYQFWMAQLVFLPLTGGMAFVFHKWINPFDKGVPVYLTNEKGTEIRKIGKYVGDYIGEDGYHNVAIEVSRKFLLFPQYEIIKCNLKGEYEFDDGNGKRRKVKLPKGFLRFYPDRVEIIADGMEKLGGSRFMFPVVYSEKYSDVLDYRLVNADRMKDTVLVSRIISLTEDFANAQRNAIKMNPMLRFEQQRKSDELEITGVERNEKERRAD